MTGNGPCIEIPVAATTVLPLQFRLLPARPDALRSLPHQVDESLQVSTALVPHLEVLCAAITSPRAQLGAHMDQLLGRPSDAQLQALLEHYDPGRYGPPTEQVLEALRGWYSHYDELPRLGRIPTKHKESDAGLDIYASCDMTIRSQSFGQISTGLSWQVQPGWYAQIQARSGMSANRGIQYLGGVVDGGYRGEWKITLGNLGCQDYQVRRGDKIAQAIILPVPRVQIQQVDRLDPSDRGARGFGSSGA